MDKSSRNIAALALLVVLLAIAGAAVAWYLFVGHSWNHAATHIDERVGDMQGYRVVLLEGATAKAEGDAVFAKANGASNGGGGPAPVTAERVAVDYRLKGATVVTLDVTDLSAYDQPTMITRNGYWVGAFALEGANARIAARRAALNLQTRDADFVVALTRDVRILNEREVARAVVDGVNMIVYAGEANLPGEGTYRGSALVIDAPRAGEVQAVIVSPSNVVSAKTISEIGQ